MADIATLKMRMGFIVELARRLHEYGTSAPRLEDVINLVAARLGLVCNVLSTPTSIVVSFRDASDEDDLGEITQVIRMPPGDVNLKRLCQVDEIADRVVNGEIDLLAGRRLLREVGARRPSLAYRLSYAASFGLSAAVIAVILHTGWAGVATAGAIGVLIGLLALAATSWPNISAASDAIGALVATFAATFVAVWVTPIEVRSVVIASLIVLLPGMTLTTAVRELSSQHLISGTARMMGAVATLLKLAFGTVAAIQLCRLFGLEPLPMPMQQVPVWTEWAAVVVAGLSFAVLFRAALRHYPVVVAAVVLSYVCTQVAGEQIAPAFGVFLGALVIGAVANLYARIAHRPGAVIREPGIILLVPGSVGFRTLNFVFERDVMLGIDTAITLVTLLLAIVAGLLFGDLLVPARRKL
jgi:uncharacterized membrane protein YjjP (DUF1212 family)